MLEHCIAQAKLEDEEIRDLEFHHEILEGEDLSGLLFHTVRFDCCQFRNCHLSRASLEQVTFVNCDFSRCMLTDTYWRQVCVQDSRGDGANLGGSHLRECSFQNSSFCYANCSHTLWDSCTIQSCVLKGAFWSESKLKKLKLQQVGLTSVDFFRTPLKGVDLSDCTIDGMMVSDTFQELKGAKISAAQAVDIAVLLGMKVL